MSTDQAMFAWSLKGPGLVVAERTFGLRGILVLLQVLQQPSNTSVWLEGGWVGLPSRQLRIRVSTVFSRRPGHRSRAMSSLPPNQDGSPPLQQVVSPLAQPAPNTDQSAQDSQRIELVGRLRTLKGSGVLQVMSSQRDQTHLDESGLWTSEYC